MSRKMKKEYDYVDNDKGLALVIVDEPGTYEVCSYDNGNRIAMERLP